MKRRILMIDGQVFQTPALFRGMGKYTNQFFGALLSESQGQSIWDEVVVVLNENMREKYDIADELDEWYDKVAKIRLPLLPNEKRTYETSEYNRKILNTYLLGKYQGTAIDFFIPALFQSEICPVFPSVQNVHGVLLMHDLIPLKFYDVYLKNEETKIEYLTKMTECFHADSYVTVSKTVANDFCLYTGTKKERVTPILGGPIKHSKDIVRMDTPKPFVLMTTGNDVRKNNKRGIQGFELFNKKHGEKYELIMTSFYLPHEIEEFSRLSKNIRFVGNLSGEQMNDLYSRCEVMLFPTEDEGLGLPILEALQRDRPVACSDIPVFREMSEDGAFQYFDFSDSESIAAGLDRAVSTKVNKRLYKQVLDDFSWQATAERFLHHMRSKLERSPRAKDMASYAICAPDPAISKAGAVAQKCMAELARGVQQYQCYIEKGSPSNAVRADYMSYLFPELHSSAKFFTNPAEKTIYFIDNSKESAWVIARAISQPGIVVLVDASLEIPWNYLVEQGIITQKRMRLEDAIDNQLKGNGKKLGSVLYGQERIIAVGREVKQCVNEICLLINEPLPQSITELRTDFPCEDLVKTKDNKGAVSPSELVDMIVKE